MSQLDISISFSQLIGLLLSFYFFIFYIISIIIHYWYNKRIRIIEFTEKGKDSIQDSTNVDLIKRILK